jgi:hypothetical protein
MEINLEALRNCDIDLNAASRAYLLRKGHLEEEKLVFCGTHSRYCRREVV